MKWILYFMFFCLTFFPVFSQQLYNCNIDAKITVTTSSLTKLAKELTYPDYHNAVIAIKGLKAGIRYQATLSYEAGTGISYLLKWIDGSPWQADYRNLGGFSSDTGRGTKLAGYEAYHLFLVDPKSRADTIYLVINSDKPWSFNLIVTQANPAFNKNTKNSYGYFATTDWSDNGRIAFLLNTLTTPQPTINPSRVIELKPSNKISLTTDTGINLPTSFGSSSNFYAVLRLSNLEKGVKYQLTVTYEGGTDIYYGLSWVNGSPLEKNWQILGSIGSATGKSPRQPGYETYHLFMLSASSQKNELYLVISSDKPWAVNFALAPANPAINELTKNSYGFFATQDWTQKGKVFFELK